MKIKLHPTTLSSPLRYPGGKALLSTYIAGVIEENYLTGCNFYEPYAGGASVSLDLLRLGFISKSVLVEKDPLVYSFWWSAIHSPQELIKGIEACPISIETWNDLQATRLVTDPSSSEYSLLQLGLAGLFFNRTNFSGIIGAGPIGGKNQSSKYKIDCRFNKKTIISQIESLQSYRDRIEINFGDAVKFMQARSKEISTGFSFTYIDPPYYLQGPKLYRHSYTDNQHQELAEFIREQGYPWLLSYDDHPRIRELYSNKRVQPIYLDYKVKSNRRAQELVISNLVIPPPVYPEANSSQAINAASPEKVNQSFTALPDLLSK